MPNVHQLRNLFFKAQNKDQRSLIIPWEKQMKSWRKANRKMSWGIKEEEFRDIKTPPLLAEQDTDHGFMGAVLFYGFGDDGLGNSDAVLSGKLAWDYARKRWWRETWQCEYIDFNRTDDIRLRPGAPARPKGFYYAEFRIDERFQSLTVSQARKKFSGETGCGPEGIQFLAVTHTHFQRMMNDREIPFMSLADYDVAPYGFNDFFDAAQMFCGNNVLGLGIGNLNNRYPLFGIPTILLDPQIKS
jgi:hypothetical protein